MRLSDHPTIRSLEASGSVPVSRPAGAIDEEWLRQLVLDAGADDAGFVRIDREELDDQRDDILAALPGTRTLISFVVRMNREPIRTPARSAANLEFHHAGDQVNDVGRDVVRALEDKGVRALNPSMGFPMEMDRFPGKIWVVSHKPVAVAAGLGQMGIHRNVIHPKFGNFILLGTILTELEVTTQGQTIDFNPCLECKLCVAACPVGAISPEGNFDFSACYTHNYREFMGGFTVWTEEVAESRSRYDYRNRVNDAESASMWQSLSFGANYKAAYCLSVCPAGEDVIGPYVDDRKAHLNQIVKPLQQKEEAVYVLKNSDAEDHVARRFPNKQTRYVGNSLRPRSVDGFLNGVPLVFQSGKSEGLAATYHFTFTGDEHREATIVIRDQQATVEDGHIGEADLKVTADTATWLGFLAQEKSLLWALLTRRIRMKGSPLLLVAFGRCFPQ